MKKKNPVIEKAKMDGYAAGFNDGRDRAINFFSDWLLRMDGIDGIGPVTRDKIVTEFLKEYGAKNGGVVH